MNRPSPRQLQSQCDEWNAAHQIGTPIKYHPIIGRPESRPDSTRSAAFVMEGHTAVVMLNKESGCVALEACEPANAGSTRSRGSEA